MGGLILPRINTWPGYRLLAFLASQNLYGRLSDRRIGISGKQLKNGEGWRNSLRQVLDDFQALRGRPSFNRVHQEKPVLGSQFGKRLCRTVGQGTIRLLQEGDKPRPDNGRGTLVTAQCLEGGSLPLLVVRFESLK